MKRRGGGLARKWGQTVISRATRNGLTAAALLYTAAPHTVELRAESFTLVSAQEAVRVEENNGYQTVLSGETAEDPSRFRTRYQGHLHLANSSLQLELQELSDITIEKNVFWQGDRYIARFLKTAPDCHAPAAIAAYELELHRGTVFIKATEKAISVYAGEARVDAQNAVFALSTSYHLGQRVSVIQGQLKVRNADHSITFVPTGQTLHTGPNLKPSLGPLQQHPNAVTLQKSITAFAQTTLRFETKGLGSISGTTAQKDSSIFEFTAPQNAALLETRNEPKIETLKVATEPRSSPR